MIRINFIAHEIARQRRDRVRKMALVIYAALWGFSLAILLGHYYSQQSEIATYENGLKEYKHKIEQVSPAFQKAITLYRQRNKHKKELAEILDLTIESGFLIESLENLVQVLPETFWLQKLHITSKPSQKADNKKGAQSKRMLISGNVLIDMTSQEQDQVRSLQTSLRENEPYSLAESYLDLNKMKVAKLRDRYFHNFELEFRWPNIFL